MPAKLDRQAIIPKLCERLAQGESLRAICAERDMPNRMTIYEWSESDPDLATAIARARNAGFDERAERAVEECRTAKDAGLARLSFDAERWYLSKLNPQRYGERIQTAQTDVEGNPQPQDPMAAAAALAGILAAARQRKENDGSDLA